MPSLMLNDNVELIHKLTNGELMPTKKNGIFAYENGMPGISIGYRNNRTKSDMIDRYARHTKAVHILDETKAPKC